MKKLNPIYNSIFYILSSLSLLTNSFLNFGAYIFDKSFNDVGIENKTIIVFLIISCLFIAFSFALTIYEIYKFIKKEKPIDAFNYFAIGYFITALSYTITSYYFTNGVYYGIVLFIILSLLIALPFLIKLFDKKDFIDVPFCDADSKSLICLSRQSQISAYIHRIFKQESSKEYGKIYIIAQPKHLDKINLSAYLLNFGDNISIQHILCMDNSKDILSSEQNYNINCFKALLPFYGMQYEYIPYYYYDQVSSHFGSFNLMPCLFLTSSEAVVCSDDLMEGFYFSSPDVISSLSRYFHNALSNAKPLSTSFRSVLDTFLQNFYHKTSSQTMQYYLAAEPCLIRFFRDEILEQHLKSDIPDRENVLELLKAYVRKQKSFKNYYYFFTKKGMENFLETGRLHEIPDEIYEAFHYSDRIDFLRQLYEENQAQPRTFLLKGNLADIPDNFNLFGSASTGFLLFSKYYGLPSFLLLQEPEPPI